MFDFNEEKAKTLAWYVQLAETPGWKEYAWHAVNEIARQDHEFYGDLPQLLTTEMRKRQEVSA